MSNKAIYTAAAPSAIGPYSQGISAREYAFISGQLPIDPATGAFPSEDIAAQTRQSLLNLKAIIEANGMTMADVVKTTVLLADINEFGAMNEVYGEFFAEPYVNLLRLHYLYRHRRKSPWYIRIEWLKPDSYRGLMPELISCCGVPVRYFPDKRG